MNDSTASPAAESRTNLEQVATLTLNRPRQYNALSPRPAGRAPRRARCASPRDESVRVVMITGAGNAFCSGHDLKEMRALGSPGRSGSALHVLQPR